MLLTLPVQVLYMIFSKLSSDFFRTFVILAILMRVINKKKLEKFRRKNRGNIILSKGINDLIEAIEYNTWENGLELSKTRIDADCVHPEGFFFFDITRADRTMILIEFDENEATIVWVGNHDDYISNFKNNKNTIKAWLKSNGWIE